MATRVEAADIAANGEVTAMDRLAIDARLTGGEGAKTEMGPSELGVRLTGDSPDLQRFQRALQRRLLEFAFLAGGLLLAGALAPLHMQSQDAKWVLCYGFLVLLFNGLSRASRQQIRLDLLNDIRDLVLATTLAAMTTLSLRVLLTEDPTVAAQTLSIWVATTGVLVPSKIALAKLELNARRAGTATRPTLIVGAGEVGQLAARRLLDQAELGLRPVGFLDKTPLAVDEGSVELPVLGASWDLAEVVQRHGIEHVIFTFSTAPHRVLLRMVSRCHELGVSVSVVPRLFEKMTTKISVDHLGGLPLISIHASNPKGWQLRLKYRVERLVAAVLIVFLSPILVACAVAVWISLGRPLLFRQHRVGQDGQDFELLKFRSMRPIPNDVLPNLPPDTAPGGVETSEQLTRTGRFIRKTSLDELPQLINVLRGEMSLVGPRPERPEFTEVFLRKIHRYPERLRVKSGITGWAQVHGLRGRTSLADRVEWDNYYIDNWSPWLDMRILLMTARAVLRGSGN